MRDNCSRELYHIVYLFFHLFAPGDSGELGDDDTTQTVSLHAEVTYIPHTQTRIYTCACTHTHHASMQCDVESHSLASKFIEFSHKLDLVDSD